jgi:hypothetical protein
VRDFREYFMGLRWELKGDANTIRTACQRKN